MLYGMYLSTGGMMVERHRLDVIANNLANATTTSFKRDVAYFSARAVESMSSPSGSRYRHEVLDDLGGGTFVSPTYTEFAQGEVEETGRELDIYIKGQGFLEVQSGKETCYTRDGRLTTNDEGLLVTVDGGNAILNGEGQPIRLDRTRDIKIGFDGQINQGGQIVAQLKVVEFDNPHLLQKIGNSMYANPTQAPARAGTADLMTKALERSTVDPVTELVAMIETQRAYEANAQMIRLQDDTLGRVINGLTQNV